MINDREKLMEQRRREYQQDKVVYSLIGEIIKWGVITWIGCSIIWLFLNRWNVI